MRDRDANAVRPHGYTGKTPGQAAYERWVECLQLPRSKHLQDNLSLQPWQKLSNFTRSIWESVATAAINAK